MARVVGVRVLGRRVSLRHPLAVRLLAALALAVSALGLALALAVGVAEVLRLALLRVRLLLPVPVLLLCALLLGVGPLLSLAVSLPLLRLPSRVPVVPAAPHPESCHAFERTCSDGSPSRGAGNRPSLRLSCDIP
ncbi:hypothetical protein GCM10010278_08160 [Streptomyces melanogenes]|nr:hypothetical protein GCM10010278_08160 [Streptomyces melanogenes]